MTELYIKNLELIPSIPKLRAKALNYVFEKGLVPQDEDLWLEFGTYDGRSINKIALQTSKTIYGFDSFEGLPEPWIGRVDEHGQFHHPAGAFNLGGANPNFSVNQFFVFENVKLIKGWFKDSLPEFFKEHDSAISFIHLDSDVYSSAVDIFENTVSRIKEGCIIVFDELLGYPNFQEHEWKAFWEFVEKYGVEFEWIGCNVDSYDEPSTAENPFGWGAPSFHLPVSPSCENAAIRITSNPHFKFASAV